MYDPPTPPDLPTAGSTALDPTFGTTILRVTDADDDPTGCVAPYSYWPTFNADSSRLFVWCYGTGDVLYDFDWKTLTLSKQGALFSGFTPEGTAVSWEDAFWSATDPDVIYAHDDDRLYAYDVTTEAFTLLRDFTADIPASAAIKQMSRSEDDDVFAWYFQDYTTVSQGYVVWRRSDDTVLALATGISVNEVQLNKDGAHLLVNTGNQGAGVIENQVVDLSTGGVEDLTDNDPDDGLGHEDQGTGFAVGADNWNNRLTWRTLDAPHDVSTVLSFGSDWTFDYHISLRARDEDWALISTYAYTGVTSGLFHEELFEVATDGSGRVRRLAHHQTVYKDYWTSPRANLSADGCFATFTSTWGDSGRTDVFVTSLQ